MARLIGSFLQTAFAAVSFAGAGYLFNHSTKMDMKLK